MDWEGLTMPLKSPAPTLWLLLCALMVLPPLVGHLLRIRLLLFITHDGIGDRTSYIRCNTNLSNETF